MYITQPDTCIHAYKKILTIKKRIDILDIRRQIGIRVHVITIVISNMVAVFAYRANMDAKSRADAPFADEFSLIK